MDAVPFFAAKRAQRHAANPHVRALNARLRAARNPAVIALLGDSTGNGPEEWFRLALDAYAARFPGATFTHRLWNDTTQSYDLPTTVTTGTNGDAYAGLTGTSGDYLSTPDSAALDITGDIDVRAKIEVDLAAAGEKAIIVKFQTGDRSWRLYFIDGDDHPRFQWNDGTTLQDGVCDASVPYGSGEPFWLRATLDVDNGAGGCDVRFYTSTDGTTWTQLGSTITQAFTTSIHAGTDIVEIGSRGGGVANLWSGRVYEAVILDGIDGTVVASPNLDLAFPDDVSTFGDAEGNTWTVNGSATVGNGAPGVLVLNASMPGGQISYSDDAARFPKQVPIEPELVLVSYGHNGGSTSVAGYQGDTESLATRILTAYADTGVVLVTQNPKKSPQTAGNIRAQFNRQQGVLKAAAVNGYGVIDAFTRLLATGDYEAYVSSDGTHPNTLGWQVWKDETIGFLTAL